MSCGSMLCSSRTKATQQSPTESSEGETGAKLDGHWEVETECQHNLEGRKIRNNVEGDARRTEKKKIVKS